ncbi:MAG TPA: ABC transporter permease [Gemmatimonadaceae bacterium]
MTLSDLKYAFRSLARARGFTVTVVLTLGLGIGATTAIFSVVRGVLLRPLPHRDGDRLMYLRQSITGPGGENVLFSVPEINDFRNNAQKLGTIAEYSQLTYTMIDKGGDASRINVGLVTGNYFKTMGLTTVLGRTLNDNDDGTKVPPVMVLTNAYWHSRFGGDPTIIGRKLMLDGRPVEVVGVAEAAPFFPNRMDAILNMVISEHHTSALMQDGRTHRMTEMIARLAPGATVEEARAEVNAIRARVQKQFVESYDPGSGFHVTVTPFQEVMGQRAKPTLYMLMGAAAFVLLISCANVTNLTLMRSVRREHELVLRAALGAGARKLRQLLLVENLVLATAGAALGLIIARGGVVLLTSLAARYSPRADEIHVDGMVLGFTLLLTIAVAVLLSFAPSVAKEGALGTFLSAGTTRSSGGLRRQRLQRALVVAQIAVSVVLLTGAGLLTRTMVLLSQVDDGLKKQDVLTMEVPVGGFSGPASDSIGRSAYERMRLEVAALPGVQSVGVGSAIPLTSSQFQLDVKAEGRALAPGEPMPRAEYRTGSPEFFESSGIPLIKGRTFYDTDRRGSALVVIINQTLAKTLFPDRDPIGQRIAWTGDVLRFIPVTGAWRMVVGVVGDTKDAGLDQKPVPVVYQPFQQEVFFGTGGLVIRARQDALALSAAATRLVRSIVPNSPIEHVRTISQIRDESVAPRRLNAALLSSFSGLAVLIAAVGIAGVLAFSVSARTNEIGIRMSLGADSSRVLRMILMEGGVLLALGLAAGIGGAIAATRLMQGLLFGVTPTDPETLAGVAVVMAAIGVAACWLPARRAASIDPAITMRGQ